MNILKENHSHRFGFQQRSRLRSVHNKSVHALGETTNHSHSIIHWIVLCIPPRKTQFEFLCILSAIRLALAVRGGKKEEQSSCKDSLIFCGCGNTLVSRFLLVMAGKHCNRMHGRLSSFRFIELMMIQLEISTFYCCEFVIGIAKTAYISDGA